MLLQHMIFIMNLILHLSSVMCHLMLATVAQHSFNESLLPVHIVVSVFDVAVGLGMSRFIVLHAPVTGRGRCI